MKKASQILLLVGGIYSFVVAWSYLMLGIGCIVAAAVGGPEFVNYLQEVGVDFSQIGLTAEQVSTIVTAGGVACGVVFILWCIFAVANGVIALLGRKKENKTFYLLNAIFGTLSGVIVNGVGGVMGMFTLPKREEVDAQ